MNDEYILELKDIKENDRIWCISRYNELIMNALDRVLNDNILSEKHHIIPKCLGGSNKPYNLVKLTYREHTLAHVLLSHIYPTNPKIWIAASLLLGVKRKYINGKLVKVKNYSTIEEAAKYRERAIILGLNKSPRKHWKHSEESKKRMSIAQKKKFSKLTKEERSAIYGKHGKDHKNFGKHLSEETKRKIGEKQKGRTVVYTEEQRKKCSDIHKGIPKSRETRKKLSKSLKGRIIKRVQGPDGIIYNSLRECSKNIGYSKTSIKKWIEKYPEKGFKFVD